MSKVSRAKLAAFARDVAEYTEQSADPKNDNFFVGLCDKAQLVWSSPKWERAENVLIAYLNTVSHYYRQCVSTFLWDQGDPARIIGGYLLAEVLESEAADEEAS